MRLCVSGVVLAVSFVSGCGAGSISGEIDGKTVPAFVDAAFGFVEDETDAFGMNGYAMPGDSCEDGGEFLQRQADLFDAAADSVDRFNSEMEDFVDFTNDLVPVGDWYAILGFVGADIDKVRDEVYDVEDLDEDEFVSLQVCLHKREHDVETVDGVAEIVNGDECFTVGEGKLRFALNDDDSILRVTSEKEVEMQFDDGDKAGDVTIDITFKGCPAIADGSEALLEARN